MTGRCNLSVLEDKTRQRIGNLARFGYQTSIVVAFVCLVTFFAEDLGHTDPKGTRFSDFAHYYRMARIALSPERQQLYNGEVQLRFFNDLQVAQPTNFTPFNQYPPIFFLLVMPLGLLSFKTGFYAWSLMGLATACLSLALLMRRVGERRWSLVALYMVAGLVSAPGWVALAVGQFSWFVLALFTLFFWSILSNRAFACGASLVLLSCKFQYLPVLVIVLLAQRRYRALLYAGIVLAMLLLVCATVFGWHTLVDYPGVLLRIETDKAAETGVFTQHMISLRGFLANIFNDRTALLISGFVMLAALLPLYRLWGKLRMVNSPALAGWAIAVTTLACLVLSTHSHIYDDVLLLLVGAATLTGAAATGLAGRAFTAWNLLLLSFPFVSWIMLVASSLETIKRVPFCIFNLVMLALAISILTRQCPQPAREGPEADPHRADGTSNA